MKIELIVDKNCLSLNTFMEMVNKVAREFSGYEIKITSFETDRKRLTNLEINLLPAWLIDNEVLRINPGNFEVLRNHILSKSDQQNVRYKE